MRLRTLVLLALPLGPAACDPASGDRVSTRYDPVTDVQGIMLSVLEPAAETYWDAVGWILDFDGETYVRPQTEEEWEAVLHSAYVVAEAGNLLMMPDRALDAGPWMAHSRDLVEVGRRAIAAAEARDPQAVFDAGAEVYVVCSECHASYALETLRPNDERTDSTAVVPPDGAGS